MKFHVVSSQSLILSKLKPWCIFLNHFCLATSMCWSCPCLLFVSRIAHTLLFLSIYLVSLHFLVASFGSFGWVEFSLGTVLLILTATIKGSMWCLVYHPRLFSASTYPLHPINPPPPAILETYTLSISLLGSSFLFNVMTFLVFLSISSGSLFVHFTIPASYLLKETAHVFIAVILFLPLSLLFMINFFLLRYYLKKFSFILLSLILLHSKISRYLYPFFSTSLILSPSGISSPSDDSTFPLFSTSILHFFIPDSIPKSILNICTVKTNPFTSHPFSA